MKRKHLLFFFLLIVGAGATAQQHRFQMGVGYQRTWMVDRQASPLKYQSMEKTISLGYSRTASKGKLYAQLGGALGEFLPTGFQNRQFYHYGQTTGGNSTTDSVPINGMLYNGRLTIGYVKKISRETNNLFPTGGSYAGLSFNNQLFYTDNVVRTGWLNAATVNADYLRELINFPRHFAGLKISVPLAGVNTRLPYHNSISSSRAESDVKTFFRQGSRLASVLDFQAIQLGLQYQYAVSTWLGIGVQYFGQWLHYTKEQPLTLFQNNIGLSLSF